MSHLFTPSIRLADHVRACRIGRQVILLDLQKSKYIGIGGPQAATLSSVIAGWPPCGSVEGQSSPPFDATPTIGQFREAGLVTDSTLTARRSHELRRAAASLDADECDEQTAIQWGHLIRLWKSTQLAAYWLKRLSLAEIACRVEAMRAQQIGQIAGEWADPRTLQQSVAGFLRLRPFALTSHDRCLNDSLAMILFLARDGLYPRWVIGVQTHPFAAHSWIQAGDVVVNDKHERVRRFEPILVV